MKFRTAIDLYVRDMWASGRFTSKRSEVSYRACLNRHADDVDNRDPRYVGREDIKKTLAHWTKPNTQRVNRSALMSFYKWTVEENHRTTNPVEQTRRPRRQPVNRYRLTAAECTR